MGALDFLNPLSGALGAVGGIVGDIANIGINQKNLQLQTDTFNYQKDLQRQMFSREDNAVQRRVADLKAAGLNPTLAAGSAAQAGPVVSVQSPKQDEINIRSPQQIADLMGRLRQNDQIELQNKLVAQQGQTEMMRQENIDADTASKRIANDQAAYDLAVSKSIEPGTAATIGALDKLIPGIGSIGRLFIKPTPGVRGKNSKRRR